MNCKFYHLQSRRHKINAFLFKILTLTGSFLKNNDDFFPYAWSNVDLAMYVGSMVISKKHGTYKLPRDLLNDERLRKLGNIRKCFKTLSSKTFNTFLSQS